MLSQDKYTRPKKAGVWSGARAGARASGFSNLADFGIKRAGCTYGSPCPYSRLLQNSLERLTRMLRQLLSNLQLEISTVIYTALAVVPLVCLVFVYALQSSNQYATRRALRHLRCLNMAKSNMTDQYDPKFDAPEGTTAQGPIRIKAIYIHPVKSCGPIEVDRALLTKSGFMYDRCFSFATEDTKKESAADGSNWRFISQRTKPAMSQIKTEIWLPHKDSNQHDPLVQTGGCVVLTFRDPDPPTSWTSRLETLLRTGDPSAPPEFSFIVPLQPTSKQAAEFDLHEMSFGIHYRITRGLDVSQTPSTAAALPKLKKFLGIPASQTLALLRCTPDSLSRTDKNLAPLNHIGSPAVHAFTDQQPVNINSLASVHAVSALLPRENQPLDALRFRANLWVSGAPAYDEESWKRYRVRPHGGESAEPRARVAPALSVVCRTSRCTIPNIDLSTGEFEADIPPPEKKRGKPQPSATLVEYRTVESGNKAALGYIGMHCVPEDRDLKDAEAQEVGLFVEVGDTVEVLERGEHLYGSTGDDY